MLSRQVRERVALEIAKQLEYGRRGNSEVTQERSFCVFNLFCSIFVSESVVCVYISEAVCSVSSAHVTAFAGVHLGERHWGGWAQGIPLLLRTYILTQPSSL